MNKEAFVKRITLIKEFNTQQLELSKMIDKISDGFCVITIGDSLVYEIIEMINEELSIIDETLLEWWLYERSKKVIFLHGKEINVEKAEDLYDFIVEHCSIN
jgi:hypothetical protein